MELAKESKQFIIIIITIAISLFHLTASNSEMWGHAIHRELFFIPIILSCFWFGLKPGLIATCFISMVYASKAFFGTGAELMFIPILFQIFTFLLIAIILGTLVGHNEKFHEENIRKKELAALGNAALNLGTEIQDVIRALKKAFAKLADDSTGKDEIDEGLNRLNNLVEILTSFVTKDNNHNINLNINSLIDNQILILDKKAKSAGILIETALDKKGCPSKISEEAINKLIKDLLVNSIEASPNGGKIVVRSSHRSTYNIIEVQDEGTGIKQEHLKKMFRPFFTTKNGSHGLSLASDYKFIQSCGGDLNVSSVFGEGTTFKIKIPIDDPSKPVNSQNQIADWNPKKE